MASRELRRAVRGGDLAAVKALVNGKEVANQISNAHVGSTLLFAAVQVRPPCSTTSCRLCLQLPLPALASQNKFAASLAPRPAFPGAARRQHRGFPLAVAPLACV
eukprot:SAG22_NODE_1525_length_4227_cov_3.189196_3_plen_105_part_00